MDIETASTLLEEIALRDKITPELDEACSVILDEIGKYKFREKKIKDRQNAFMKNLYSALAASQVAANMVDGALMNAPWEFPTRAAQDAAMVDANRTQRDNLNNWLRTQPTPEQMQTPRSARRPIGLDRFMADMAIPVEESI